MVVLVAIVVWALFVVVAWNSPDEMWQVAMNGA